MLVWIAARDNKPEKAPPDRPISGKVPRSFSLVVNQVASKFLCGCGTCDVPELAECTCPTAIEEKELIERELNQGTSEPKLLKLVENRYGGIKAQYASLVGGAGDYPPSEASPIEKRNEKNAGIDRPAESSGGSPVF